MQGSVCNRKKSMIVNDKTIQAEGPGDFFKIFGKKGLKVSKKLSENALNKPTRALDITANPATAVVSKNVKILLKTLPEVMNFYLTGQGLYLPRFA